MAPDDDDADPSTAYRLLQPVLLVDDNDDARSLLAEVLRLDGFRVIEACDGPEALAACEREVPWLVILDHVMPTMSGIEVATRLAHSEAWASIPVVFATGSELPEAIAPNVIAVLTKPVKARRLLDLVRACATGSVPNPRLDQPAHGSPVRWGDGAQAGF